MKKIDFHRFSEKYKVRRLNDSDIPMIYDFCKSNTQYYRYCGQDVSVELIENDIHALPPGCSAEQKYYLGFFDGDTFVALIDLIDGYPEEDYVFIGFFMVNNAMQGKNTGSRIIENLSDYLKSVGFRMCRLGIDKDNPQSNRFWRKNGFEVIREVKQENGTVLVAEKNLTDKIALSKAPKHD